MRLKSIANIKEFEMSIDMIGMWHKRARPSPSSDHLNVQTGCHFEEVMEMVAVMTGDDDYSRAVLDRLHTALTIVSIGMKHGTIRFHIDPEDRKEFLDSLADQIVTATGVGHCAKMNIVEAVRRVNSSNWSKYDTDGKPIFNEHGKITKGPNYKPPQLDGLY
jgi:predicted HAD superfamily Cof-like phosphohydrolase